MATSTRAGTMDAYKPRRPGTTYEDSMTSEDIKKMNAQKEEAKDEEEYQKRKTAPTTKTEMGKAFAKGGMTASSRADGCATKGKTKGTMVVMKNGGMC
jgi:hypothetical protein